MVAYTFYEADNRVRRYAEALARRGDEVDAIVLRRPGQAPFEIIRGVRVYRIQRRTIDENGPFAYLIKLLLFLVRSSWSLLLRSIKQRYDLVHVHSVPDFEVFAALLPRMLGTKVILDIHDLVPEFYASKFGISEKSLIFRLLVWIERLSAKGSNHVIISNHLWYQTLTRRSVQPAKCTAIINYPDLSLFYRRPRSPRAPSEEFTLCYPGTLNRHQGLDVAINAVGIVQTTMPNIRFRIIGRGPERDRLQQLIRERRLEDCVTISDPVPIEKISEVMANTDLGIVPKRRDSFGNEAFSTKIMEFMAMGVPVVASDTRIDRYYFNDDLVQFCESGNAPDFAAKIIELAGNPEQSDALRSKASKFIERNNWEVKKYEYFDLVGQLLSGKRYVHDPQDARTPA